MEDLTQCERGLVAMLDELRACPQVALHRDDLWPADESFGDADTVFARIAEWYGVALDPALKRCFFRFAGIMAHWSADAGGRELSGEFTLCDLLSLVADQPPDLGVEFGSEFERELEPRLRVLDDTRFAGAGKLTALRIEPDTPDPELWFFDVSRGFFKLDIDYCGYLEALPLTKGVHGWQYLFTDVRLADEAFRGVLADMRNMLDVLPGLFPDHDYTALTDRLAQRL
ncbi:hypothetical protein [Streptomyces albireticuli]|nr:hypothetical protein [Streptomyces albireticuli]MCD9194182.1 hypothetical protein [Streptomyces albireticuli]